MAESIFSRVKRIISGSVEDMVDNMEKAGGSLVMREAIRELDRVVDDVKSERDEVTARRLQAVRQQRMFKERLGTMQEKAQFAMDNNREDLAEAALHRQIDFEAQVEKLAEVEAEASVQEKELEEALASLEMRKAHMEEELKHFDAARAEAGLDSVDPEKNRRNVMSKVDRIETAYNRAMEASGGKTFKADAANSSKVAEIDVMKKKSEIESRMDALRSQKKAG